MRYANLPAALHMPPALLRSALLLLFAPLGVRAQTASDNCGYNAGNQYTVGSSCVTQAFNKPNTFTNALTPTGCSASNQNDAWGWFTATATTTTVTYDNTTNFTDGILHLFTGACGSLTQVACSNAGGNNAAETITLNTTPGTNYMMRVQRNGSSGTMNGTICVWSPPPPANDNPCGATALTMGAGSCTNAAATNINATATPGIPAPGCANYGSGDVWFSFVAPGNGAATIRTTAGSLTDSGIALYSAANCSGPFTLLACNDDGNGTMSQIAQTGLTPGATYYVRVWGKNTTWGAFSICVYSPLTNNTPCNAQPLSLGSACNYQLYHNGGAGTTAGIPDPGCGGTPSNDVWFSFTAPASGHVAIRTTAGSITNLGIAVYSAASCAGPFTLVACDNLDGPGNMPYLALTPLNLTPGQTYWMRAWNNGGSTGTFNLCMNTAPAGGDCVLALHMFDSQGNGWNGSYVTVQVGAGPPVNYTNTNSDGEAAYIPVANGSVVQLSYTAVGGGQSEIRYVLQQATGMLYSDGPTPGTGIRYAGAINCSAPPAPLNSDCIGSTPICNAQQISANPSNIGLNEDLNVNNRGCLSANERQGVWYRFTLSAGGTVAFTISPSNPSDDYDFAIWGPMGSGNCVGLAAPVRCNYSGTPGNTGLSTSATNASQGAAGSVWSSALPATTGQAYNLYVSNYSQSGLAFNLTWQLSAGASLDCTLLPIELLGFEGEQEGDSIRLEWATGIEKDTHAYEVQRIGDDGRAQAIGTVPAAGSSSTLTRYAWRDGSPVPGENRYRLLVREGQGEEREAASAVVLFRQPGARPQVVPNPVAGSAELVLDAPMESLAQMSLTDASGRLVRSRSIPLVMGPNRIPLPVEGLAPGPYFVAVSPEQGPRQQTGPMLIR
jgi:hypothetical protein